MNTKRFQAVKSNLNKQYSNVGVIHTGQREVLITASVIHLLERKKKNTPKNELIDYRDHGEIELPIAKNMTTHRRRDIIARIRTTHATMKRI